MVDIRTGRLRCICCGSILSVVQFYPWFKFYFPLFQIRYHTLQYPKTKEKKIWTKDKIEPQHIQQQCDQAFIIGASARVFLRLWGSMRSWAMRAGKRSARGLVLSHYLCQTRSKPLQTLLKSSCGWKRAFSRGYNIADKKDWDTGLYSKKYSSILLNEGLRGACQF